MEKGKRINFVDGIGALQGQAAEVPLPVNLHNLASEPWIQHPRLDVAAVDALPKRTENVRLERAIDARLGRANALSRVQAFVKDVKRVSLVVALTDRLSPRQSQSPMPAGDATITAVAASSQTGATPQENISIESRTNDYTFM
uniref:Uncharacterized protein n=1 Tax=Fusarium oxysporum (strain Fo5176) TaxID=660025 RepID=A0A0D2YB07_FUSOF